MAKKFIFILVLIGLMLIGCAEPIEPTAEEQAPASENTSGDSSYGIAGRINLTTPIYSGPEFNCEEIGGFEEGVIVNIIEFSQNQRWILISARDSVLSGWAWAYNVDIDGDPDSIPVGDTVDCQGNNEQNAANNDADEENSNQSCGDGVCEYSDVENCATCPDDCGICIFCGNGICESDSGEDCVTCDQDCDTCPSDDTTSIVCGDGYCDPDTFETCHNCEADCGRCVTSLCGNGTCDPWEQAMDCPQDCSPPGTECGNGICESGENHALCPMDCSP